MADPYVDPNVAAIARQYDVEDVAQRRTVADEERRAQEAARAFVDGLGWCPTAQPLSDREYDQLAIEAERRRQR